MKATTKQKEIDYYIWDGNSDGLQIWMNEFNEKIKDFFDLQMYDEEDELMLNNWFISKDEFIIRDEDGIYSFLDKEDFTKQYIIL